jgi:dihydrofolate synthase/folylpolyglutamate synthase
MSLSVEYSHAVQYILDIPRFAREKHSLAELKSFLANMGHPATGIKVIHVAGTNGKGSVCAYLQSILLSSGITCGLFTSPHLVTMRERIQINGQMIDEEEFLAVFCKLRENLAAAGFTPTFFEFLFLMALLVFARRDVEYIILETGLGGRLDATNALAEKKLAVITRLGYDHMEQLGQTLAEIAAEKAGIMRAGVPVVTIRQKAEAGAALERAASAQGAALTVIDADDAIIAENIDLVNKTIDFSYQYGYDRIEGLRLATRALYQMENASLAIKAALLLGEGRITAKAVAEGLAQAVWPGRMEEVAPGLIVDGAHNMEGISAFLASVAAIPCQGARYLLFAAAREKRGREMLDLLVRSGQFCEIVTCPLDNERTLTVSALEGLLGDARRVFGSVGEALRYLRKKKEPSDLIFTAGSLYLVGEVKKETRKIP